MALTDQTVRVVKACVPALETHGASIILEFYDVLFERYPHLKRHFNMDRQKGGSSAAAGVPAQVAALAGAVMAYAKNIDNIPSLIPTVERIAHKHVSRAVESDHYNAVGECLLAAIQTVLKDAATADVMNAWTEAFTFLANTFRQTEKTLRQELAIKAGYDGFTNMIVSDVDVIDGKRKISFVPESVPVPLHARGQYVAVCVKGTNGEDMMCTVPILEENEDCLVVTVGSSKEAASVFLMENTTMGSILSVSMPCGQPNSSGTA